MYSNLSQAYMNNTKIKYDIMENYENLTENDISKLTDLWIKEVTINHDSEAVYKLFCSDGKLVGTVSQVIPMEFGDRFRYRIESKWTNWVRRNSI